MQKDEGQALHLLAHMFDIERADFLRMAQFAPEARLFHRLGVEVALVEAIGLHDSTAAAITSLVLLGIERRLEGPAVRRIQAVHHPPSSTPSVNSI
jgi:hypothetical protein